jgi:hypothetical protein
VNGKQVIKVLKEDGWEVVRVNGSHHRFAKEAKEPPSRCMEPRISIQKPLAPSRSKQE